MPTNDSVKRALDALEKDKSKMLGVAIDGKLISTAQYFPRAEAQTAPQISFAVPDPSATYMVVSLDLDAPFPSWSGLGPILHWIQPGFKAGPDNLLVSSDAFVADYIGPAPPPGSSPHRYVFYLFTQPSSFDGPKYAPADGKPMGVWGRIRFDFDDWIRKAQLGEPLASNYFLSN
ncbi:PEBP-like protein [Polychaeton citri CBS 116435]|uniref:PEBP-like protein n=1 Tax=Polychaeton citri CBS 116435 TaxID=1314669 RepID=A0A9P4UR09_9PEZI|nr:PEBP-like protein [Polychaeton citri CBS 116435]